MIRKPESFLKLIRERLAAARVNPDDCLRDSTQIIVFGSFAVGVERPDSDIDVLCIGKCDAKLKTNALDFLAISEPKSRTLLWQRSELAGHIQAYGIWVKGTPTHIRFSGYSEECIWDKRRRVLAFARRLNSAWEELDPDFKIKYSIKVRREVQRLIFLESHEPIPPTWLLDTVPREARSTVYQRLQETLDPHNSRFAGLFLESVEREWNRRALALQAPTIGLGQF